MGINEDITVDKIIYHSAHGTIIAGLFELGTPHIFLIIAAVIQISHLTYNFVKTIIQDIKNGKNNKNGKPPFAGTSGANGAA
ncbi:MAG: hypothetical protein KGJ07_03725 [Patescibacteria group bacterium]|nr:hypothetical protein [Patescibacteria group bacterium]